MIYVSTFVPDPEHQAEFFAALWHGQRPDTLVLHEWLSLPTDPARFMLIWEGDIDAMQWVERCFGGFGDLHTDLGTGLTDGLAACLARDLNGFEQSLLAKGLNQVDIDRAVDLRRRAMQADSQDAALEAARAWQVEVRPGG
jgi:hypothetical protein